MIYVTLRRFDIGGPLRVDLTRSPHRLAMTAICAFRTFPVTAGTARLRKIAVVPGPRGGWLNALLLVLSADAFTRREVLRAASETWLAATLRNNPIG